MSLTREDVRRVALLARLELGEDELDRQSIHINRLLQEFERLQSLDVTGVEPTSHSIPLSNVLREDVVAASLDRDVALANAPEQRNGRFIVPRVIEE
jgi:aspartyl-tRNA(Asn)/glutamyl-tRNA(Gln) amidotransferase subunit C